MKFILIGALIICFIVQMISPLAALPDVCPNTAFDSAGDVFKSSFQITNYLSKASTALLEMVLSNSPFKIPLKTTSSKRKSSHAASSQPRIAGTALRLENSKNVKFNLLTSTITNLVLQTRGLTCIVKLQSTLSRIPHDPPLIFLLFLLLFYILPRGAIDSVLMYSRIRKISLTYTFGLGFFIAQRARDFRRSCGVCTLKKIISLITCICFILTSVIAQPAYGALEPRKSSVPDVKTIFDSFILPAQVGRITETHTEAESKDISFESSVPSGNLDGAFADTNLPKQVVINIQDLHCHPEVQKNIAKILASLDQKYNLKQVYVEGASGALDTSWLTGVRDQDIRNKILDALIDSGKLTGPEYYSAQSGKPNLLVGVENRKLHTENLLRLQSIIQKQKSLQEHVDTLSSDIDILKERYYNSKNKKFERLVQKYKDGTIKPQQYYKKIEDYSQKLDIDLALFKNVSSFSRTFNVAKELNFKKIGVELQAFIALLKQKLPYSTYQMLLNNTSNFSKANELYLYLSKIAAQNPSLTAEYPNLKRFFEHMALTGAVNPLELINEEQRLENEIHFRLILKQSERDIVFLAGFVKYLRDFIGYKVSFDDYNYVLANFPKFELLWAKYVGNYKLSEFDKDIALLGEYYKVNVTRNECLLDNCDIQKRAGGRGQVELTPNFRFIAQGRTEPRTQNPISELLSKSEIVVLVTGGFHTQGLTGLMKERNLSYVIITPNVTQGTDSAETIYQELLEKETDALRKESAEPIKTSFIPSHQPITALALKQLTDLLAQHNGKWDKVTAAGEYAEIVLKINAIQELLKKGKISEVNDLFKQSFPSDTGIAITVLPTATLKTYTIAVAIQGDVGAEYTYNAEKGTIDNGKLDSAHPKKSSDARDMDSVVRQVLGYCEPDKVLDIFGVNSLDELPANIDELAKTLEKTELKTLLTELFTDVAVQIKNDKLTEGEKTALDIVTNHTLRVFCAFLQMYRMQDGQDTRQAGGIGALYSQEDNTVFARLKDMMGEGKGILNADVFRKWAFVALFHDIGKCDEQVVHVTTKVHEITSAEFIRRFNIIGNLALDVEERDEIYWLIKTHLRFGSHGIGELPLDSFYELFEDPEFRTYIAPQGIIDQAKFERLFKANALFWVFDSASTGWCRKRPFDYLFEISSKLNTLTGCSIEEFKGKIKALAESAPMFEKRLGRLVSAFLTNPGKDNDGWEKLLAAAEKLIADGTIKSADWEFFKGHFPHMAVWGRFSHLCAEPLNQGKDLSNTVKAFVLCTKAADGESCTEIRMVTESGAMPAIKEVDTYAGYLHTVLDRAVDIQKSGDEIYFIDVRGNRIDGLTMKKDPAASRLIVTIQKLSRDVDTSAVLSQLVNGVKSDTKTAGAAQGRTNLGFGIIPKPLNYMAYYIALPYVFMHELFHWLVARILGFPYAEIQVLKNFRPVKPGVKYNSPIPVFLDELFWLAPAGWVGELVFGLGTYMLFRTGITELVILASLFTVSMIFANALRILGGEKNDDLEYFKLAIKYRLDESRKKEVIKVDSSPNQGLGRNMYSIILQVLGPVAQLLLAGKIQEIAGNMGFAILAEIPKERVYIKQNETKVIINGVEYPVKIRECKGDILYIDQTTVGFATINKEESAQGSIVIDVAHGFSEYFNPKERETAIIHEINESVARKGDNRDFNYYWLNEKYRNIQSQKELDEFDALVKDPERIKQLVAGLGTDEFIESYHRYIHHTAEAKPEYADESNLIKKSDDALAHIIARTTFKVNDSMRKILEYLFPGKDFTSVVQASIYSLAGRSAAAKQRKIVKQNVEMLKKIDIHSLGAENWFSRVHVYMDRNGQIVSIGEKPEQDTIELILNIKRTGRGISIKDFSFSWRQPLSQSQHMIVAETENMLNLDFEAKKTTVELSKTNGSSEVILDNDKKIYLVIPGKSMVTMNIEDGKIYMVFQGKDFQGKKVQVPTKVRSFTVGHFILNISKINDGCFRVRISLADKRPGKSIVNVVSFKADFRENMQISENGFTEGSVDRFEKKFSGDMQIIIEPKQRNLLPGLISLKDGKITFSVHSPKGDKNTNLEFGRSYNIGPLGVWFANNNGVYTVQIRPNADTRVTFIPGYEKTKPKIVSKSGIESVMNYIKVRYPDQAENIIAKWETLPETEKERYNKEAAEIYAPIAEMEQVEKARKGGRESIEAFIDKHGPTTAEERKILINGMYSIDYFLMRLAECSVPALAGVKGIEILAEFLANQIMSGDKFGKEWLGKEGIEYLRSQGIDTKEELAEIIRKNVMLGLEMFPDIGLSSLSISQLANIAAHAAWNLSHKKGERLWSWEGNAPNTQWGSTTGDNAGRASVANRLNVDPSNIYSERVRAELQMHMENPSPLQAGLAQAEKLLALLAGKNLEASAAKENVQADVMVVCGHNDIEVILDAIEVYNSMAKKPKLIITGGVGKGTPELIASVFKRLGQEKFSSLTGTQLTEAQIAGWVEEAAGIETKYAQPGFKPFYSKIQELGITEAKLIRLLFEYELEIKLATQPGESQTCFIEDQSRSSFENAVKSIDILQKLAQASSRPLSVIINQAPYAQLRTFKMFEKLCRKAGIKNTSLASYTTTQTSRVIPIRELLLEFWRLVLFVGCGDIEFEGGITNSMLTPYWDAFFSLLTSNGNSKEIQESLRGLALGLNKPGPDGKSAPVYPTSQNLKERLKLNQAEPYQAMLSQLIDWAYDDTFKPLNLSLTQVQAINTFSSGRLGISAGAVVLVAVKAMVRPKEAVSKAVRVILDLPYPNTLLGALDGKACVAFGEVAAEWLNWSGVPVIEITPKVYTETEIKETGGMEDYTADGENQVPFVVITVNGKKVSLRIFAHKWVDGRVELQLAVPDELPEGLTPQAVAEALNSSSAATAGARWSLLLTLVEHRGKEALLAGENSFRQRLLGSSRDAENVFDGIVVNIGSDPVNLPEKSELEVTSGNLSLSFPELKDIEARLRYAGVMVAASGNNSDIQASQNVDCVYQPEDTQRLVQAYGQARRVRGAGVEPQLDIIVELAQQGLTVEKLPDIVAQSSKLWSGKVKNAIVAGLIKPDASLNPDAVPAGTIPKLEDAQQQANFNEFKKGLSLTDQQAYALWCARGYKLGLTVPDPEQVNTAVEGVMKAADYGESGIVVSFGYKVSADDITSFMNRFKDAQQTAAQAEQARIPAGFVTLSLPVEVLCTEGLVVRMKELGIRPQAIVAIGHEGSINALDKDVSLRFVLPETKEVTADEVTAALNTAIGSGRNICADSDLPVQVNQRSRITLQQFADTLKHAFTSAKLSGDALALDQQLKGTRVFSKEEIPSIENARTLIAAVSNYLTQDKAARIAGMNETVEIVRQFSSYGIKRALERYDAGGDASVKESAYLEIMNLLIGAGIAVVTRGEEFTEDKALVAYGQLKLIKETENAQVQEEAKEISLEAVTKFKDAVIAEIATTPITKILQSRGLTAEALLQGFVYYRKFPGLIERVKPSFDAAAINAIQSAA
ncbi:MAG: hypothetical protein LHV68_04610 [Elusimicrobia bacterium]|nr:hypothetical protein [Candidatus Liberimonas magnetica]